MALPKYVVFEGENRKYLGPIKEEGKYKGCLKFMYDDLSSPEVKHEVKVKVSDPGKDIYVHIKCCYNNKFWSKCEKQGNDWVTAGAASRDSDVSKSSCTLFQPIVRDGNKVSLKSPNRLLFAALQKFDREEQPDYRLRISQAKAEDRGVCMKYYEVSLLPKYVAFKGEDNKYLAAPGTGYLQFNPIDSSDERVKHEVVQVGDGNVHLKCLQSNKFWRLNNTWILADRNPSTFKPIKVKDDKEGGEVVVLQCNNWFCKRLGDHLNASSDSLRTAANLLVVEKH